MLLFLYLGHLAIKSSVSNNNPKALIIRGTIYSYKGIDTGIIGPWRIIYLFILSSNFYSEAWDSAYYIFKIRFHIFIKIVWIIGYCLSSSIRRII